MNMATADRVARARACAAAIPDPEIPVVSLAELGILRAVREEAGRVVVELTPTYTGCPATEVIAEDVRRALAEAGEPDAEVRTVLSPPWTTDWISEEGRRKLRDYGIAPPAPVAAGAQAHVHLVRCPRCNAARVERLSTYGSTPCKALWRCLACREPFDAFKPY